MSNNTATVADFLSILVEAYNTDGKIDPAEVCKDIAAWINMHDAATFRYTNALYDFIYEYGEDVEETYMGRDEEGEKVYHTFNPETNWLARIRKELEAMGYYKRNPPVYVKEAA